MRYAIDLDEFMLQRMDTTKADPAPSPIEEGWTHEVEAGFVTHIGQIWRRPARSGRNAGEAANDEMAFIAEARHLNRNGRVHGGMLVALFDHAVGAACFTAVGEDALLATIQINAAFMREASPGQLVRCRVEVLRLTPSLLFLRGGCHVDDEMIMSGEATVKRRRRAA